MSKESAKLKVGWERTPGECSVQYRPLTHNYTALNLIHDTIHGDYTTHRSQKDRGKCLICLFSNVAICLMNEIDFIKCQGYLLVSNLEYKCSFIADLSACIYNGFKVKYREGYVALILPEEVKINRIVCLNKGFDNRERTNLKCWSTMIAFKHFYESYWRVV